MPTPVTESMGPPTAQLEPRQARKGATVEKSGCGGPSLMRELSGGYSGALLGMACTGASQFERFAQALRRCALAAMSPG